MEMSDLWASSRTGNGSVAGPAEKLNTRLVIR
jgi:hypothetical protein